MHSAAEYNGELAAGQARMKILENTGSADGISGGKEYTTQKTLQGCLRCGIRVVSDYPDIASIALRKIVKKKIERSNAAVASDDKIGSRVSWRLPRSAGYPSNSPGVAYFLGREDGLILEIRMRCFDRASNAIYFVTAPKSAAFGVIKYRVFVKELLDGLAAARGIIFAKYVAQIAKQQSRDAVGHCVLRLSLQAAII